MADKEATLVRQEEEKTEQRRRAKADKKSQKKSQKSNRVGEKRKAEDDYQDEWGDETARAPKKHRVGVDPGSSGGGAEEYMETETGLFGRKAPTGRRPEPPGFKRSHQGAATAEQNNQEDNPEERKDNCSVFVSNLAYTLNEPEKRVREVFDPCGPIQQVRLVFSGNGTFRGYGYVQFEGQASVPEALKRDRQTVKGRPMFVSPCVDKSKHPDFKIFRYSSALERHKIFISGLPHSCTKEQLEELCKDIGTIKDIRLVTHRSGQPKGLAYVEFADEAQASQAVLKMDGVVLQDHKLAVAISNPPRRNKDPDQPGSSRPQGAMMPRQVGSRGRGRTGLSLIPRSLHRQTGPAGKAENGTAPKPASGGLNSSGDTGHEAQTKPLSNSDFARMLMTKK